MGHLVKWIIKTCCSFFDMGIYWGAHIQKRNIYGHNGQMILKIIDPE
jgi:hypothetical protein